MKETTGTGMTGRTKVRSAVLGVSALGLLLVHLPVAAATYEPQDFVSEAGELVLQCGSAGEPLVLMDTRAEDQYSVDIYQGTASGKVYVAWNNQLPQTKKGVSIVIDGWEHGSMVSQTGSCGVKTNVDAGSTFTVTIDFGGQTWTRQTIVTTEATISFSVIVEFGFKVQLKKGALRLDVLNIGFEFSGTARYSTSDSYTVTSTHHRFQQTYAGLDDITPGACILCG